jgi:hypothetical protein
LLKRGLREEARTRLLTTLLGQKGKD